MQKDGTLRLDKSKGKLKNAVCFADEFKDAPNYTDIPENPEDALDKQLPLQEQQDPSDQDSNDSSSSSEDDSRVPSITSSSDEGEEQWVDADTAKLHNVFLEEVEEMDRAHEEYLQNRKPVLPAVDVVVEVDDVDKSVSAADKSAVVDLCKPDPKQKTSRRSASLPIPRIALATKTARRLLPSSPDSSENSNSTICLRLRRHRAR